MTAEVITSLFAFCVFCFWIYRNDIDVSNQDGQTVVAVVTVLLVLTVMYITM